MQAARIVEALDVLEQILPGLVARSVDPVMDPLGFEGVEEAFMGALSQQSPLRLIDGVMADLASAER